MKSIKRMAAVLVVLMIPNAASAQGATFEFHDGFWVNLHHLVRGEARRRGGATRLEQPLDELTADERAAWTAALDAYVDLARRDVVFDPELVRINNVLTRLRDDEAVTANGGLRADVAAALNRAAPVYRAHAWPRHRRLNEDWIAAVRPVVHAHAAALTRALAQAYRVTWPSPPIIVDVSNEAGPVGAYTTDGPSGTAGHTTISSVERGIQGDFAVEIVFHEASHTVDEALVKSVEQESARQQVTAPSQLWHGIIFYTAGELVRRELGKLGDASYLPYAYREGVWTRGDFPKYRVALERDWQPWLEGKATFEEALRTLVRDTTR
jgi:hypothetical protein